MHANMAVIIIAAALLELTSAVMYYSAQRELKTAVDQLSMQEMNSIYLTIRNKLAKVEVTLDNMAWVVAADLDEPDSLLRATRQLVLHTPDILGSSVTCVPNLFPQKGYWYEPYSVRSPDGSILSMLLGSPHHDYTKSEFFTGALSKGSGRWCEPYLDSDGAHAKVTTYSVPVRDAEGNIVAVINADISLHWLSNLLNCDKVYSSTQRFLVTGNYNLLAGQDGPLFRSALHHLKADDDKKGYVLLKDDQGKKKHVYFTPVGGKTHWFIINVLDDSDVYSQLRSIRLVLLLPLMIGLFFAAFVVYRTSRNLDNLRKANAEKDRMGAELDVASRIQQNMLPQQQLSDHRLELSATLIPAKEVGGDLYDYHLRDDKLFFYIGDVSGKGAPAALFMAVVQTKFRDFSAQLDDPAAIMHNINLGCCLNNKSCMFATMFIGVLDLSSGLLRYCNAGHDTPFLDASPLPLLPHLPVGAFEDTAYCDQEIRMERGSTLFLYTDGLTEAMNSRHEQFGIDRLRNVLTTLHPPLSTLRSLHSSLSAFVKDAPQSDDLTMLAIRYSPTPPTSPHSALRTPHSTLLIHNRLDEVAKLSDFIKTVSEELNLEPSWAFQLRLAVEEAVVNIIQYAYPDPEGGSIEVQVSSDERSLTIVIIDSGVPFDPTGDAPLPPKEGQRGGWGIPLMLQLMDTVNYQRYNNQNILTLTKKYLPS